MPSVREVLLAALLVGCGHANLAGLPAEGEQPKQHHHHHHGHHRHHAHHQRQHQQSHSDELAGSATIDGGNSESVQKLFVNTATNSIASTPSGPPADQQLAASAAQVTGAPEAANEQMTRKVNVLERDLGTKQHAAEVQGVKKGHLDVNAPLPNDFADRFSVAVAEATGCNPADVKVLGSVPVPEAKGRVNEIVFESRDDIINAVEDQAADPDSKLANGLLHSFLVARDGSDGAQDSEGDPVAPRAPTPKPSLAGPPDVDAAMPYGDLEPFGREDTAQELTQSSMRESDAMIDQLERAEVAEEKRAVFRALTRLRGAAITSFDGIARSQTGNIEEYSRNNQWRKAHPVRHLADEENDVSRWAFPESSDD